ncbi:MAG: ABC transporter ATP-binding protein [Gordonia sp. (in: high G+C Gram-positive bacteria)]|nr:MAG: ABC transporter ATP-binding protein [Gordonia sp. (in: high G+C Gram-positive bacteria)]
MTITAQGTAVLHVSDVSIVRSGRHLLDDLSMTVAGGEHWAVLGPNGAGKSTLLSLLGAVSHPSQGYVEVLGHRLGRVDLRELRSLIGHVNPRHRLDQPLTASEVVLTGLTNTVVLPPRFAPSDTDCQRALDLLAQLGMSDRLHTVWPTMSQGERGRVLIARALMSQPQLLLLDEPATGLDVAAREQLLDALNELCASNATLTSVLVTHHLEELPTSTSHVLMLRGGAAVAAGPIEDTLNSANVSNCFGHPLHVSRVDGRWTVRSR